MRAEAKRPEIKVGQVWRDKYTGREVTVVAVDVHAAGGRVTVQGVYKSHPRERTLWSRYVLVEEAPRG